MNEKDSLTLIVSTPKWIDIRELAPTDGQEVCYFAPEFGAWTGRYNGVGKLGHKFSSFYGFDEGTVTHWFPMPGRPSREKKSRGRPLNGRARACK